MCFILVTVHGQIYPTAVQPTTTAKTKGQFLLWLSRYSIFIAICRDLKYQLTFDAKKSRINPNQHRLPIFSLAAATDFTDQGIPCWWGIDHALGWHEEQVSAWFNLVFSIPKHFHFLKEFRMCRNTFRVLITIKSIWHDFTLMGIQSFIESFASYITYRRSPR